jgi:hypothetical protein
MRIVTRRQQDHKEATRLEAAQDRYERFVAEFGPAAHLSDQQLAALVGYCSAATNVWMPTIAAELLRGRAWDHLDDADVLDEDDPRVRRIVDLATTRRSRLTV